MAYIQLSLFGKTSWELFFQMTGWILEPCLNASQIPKFQCLLLDGGQAPEWLEGESLTLLGGSWTPSIGESPRPLSEEKEFLSWQILEGNVPEKYYLSPALCSRILRLAEIAQCPPPPEIEYLLQKQGEIPVLHPFQERSMRSSARKKYHTRFINSFGNPNDPFPTLLAQGNAGCFSLWYDDDYENGFLRYLTPTESERLMGLPDGWTASGHEGEIISNAARYKAIGNAIALPCAEHIMSGIQSVLENATSGQFGPK